MINLSLIPGCLEVLYTVFDEKEKHRLLVFADARMADENGKFSEKSKLISASVFVTDEQIENHRIRNDLVGLIGKCREALLRSIAALVAGEPSQACYVRMEEVFQAEPVGV